MRAVERQPWVQQRSRRHDEICAAVLVRKQRVFPRYTGEIVAHVEYPCGPGYADVVAWTDAPPEDREVCIIEVKTNDERASAGDIIRQLKWYRQRLMEQFPVRRENVRLVLVTENRVPDGAAKYFAMMANEDIEVLPAWYFEGVNDG